MAYTRYRERECIHPQSWHNLFLPASLSIRVSSQMNDFIVQKVKSFAISKGVRCPWNEKNIIWKLPLFYTSGILIQLYTLPLRGINICTLSMFFLTSFTEVTTCDLQSYVTFGIKKRTCSLKEKICFGVVQLKITESCLPCKCNHFP